MKKVLLILLPFCFVACQKKIASTSQSNPLITQAQTFFNGVLSQKIPSNSANFRANQVRVADWDQAEVKNLSVGPAVIVPVNFDNRSYGGFFYDQASGTFFQLPANVKDDWLLYINTLLSD